MKKQIITTMRGKQIDIAAIAEQHGDKIAIGNANLNARGDVLGPKGEIIKTADEITQEYYQNNPNAVTNSGPISLKDIKDEIVLSPAEAMKEYDEQRREVKSQPVRKKITRETED